MKRILMAAAALTTLGFASTASAAVVSTDDVVIGGTIPVACTVTAPADVTGLNLVSASPQGIGNVTIQCNDVLGFSVTATSAHAGFLQNTSFAGAKYAYTVTSGATTASLATPQTQSFPTPADVFPFIAGVTYPASVNVGANSGGAFSGAYSDTITFSLNAN